MLRSTTYIATPPGATIREQLADRGLTQKEFAVRMNLSEKHISKLINGEVQLTQEVARRLESVLGLPASFWNNLESIYREKLAKVHDENTMTHDMELARKFPYHEMQQLGWVSECTLLTERVMNLRQFFEVASLDILDNPHVTRIACRRISVTDKADYALLAWAQQAKREARAVETPAINLALLEKRILDFRQMTVMSPEDFCPKLKAMLLDCGIALIFLPHIKGSFLHGATFYDGKKIVVGLTVRGKYADKFWFSFFHEMAHIIYGHINNPDGTTENDEVIADTYSKNILIRENDFLEFVEMRSFKKEDILSFASSINIDAGIVVGRLQKENYIRFSTHNGLRKKYSMS